jgi:hypothetical protein
MSIFDPRPFLDPCQITNGPYKGAFRVTPDGMVCWYSANVGLTPFVRAIPNAVRGYLETYLAHLETDGTIQNVTSPDHTDARPESRPESRSEHSLLAHSLSDSGTAATFLSLAVAYLRANDDPAWFRAHQESLQKIALRNLVATQKPSGLLRAAQDSNRVSQANLQDNCEAYRALLEIAPYLTNDAERQCRTSAALILDGLAKLYDGRVGAYKPLDSGDKMNRRFYPEATSQVYPIVMGVPQTPDKKLRSWYWVNKHLPRWTEGNYDAAPWLVLGYTAALLGDKEKATQQLRYVRDLAHKKRNLVAINELGYAERLRQIGI